MNIFNSERKKKVIQAELPWIAWTKFLIPLPFNMDTLFSFC